MSNDKSSNEITISKEDHAKFLNAIAKNERSAEIAKRARIKRQAKINLLIKKAIENKLVVSDSEIDVEIKRLNSLSK